MKRAIIFNLLIAVILLIPMTQVSAREPNEVEADCLETIYRIEAELAPKLKKNYPNHSWVETHPSPLGRMLVHEEFIRDGWIKNNAKTGEFIELIVVVYDENLSPGHWTKSIPSTKQRITVKNKMIRIGLISENQALKADVIKWIEEMKW